MSSLNSLASNPLGFPFIELPTVDSTNNYAMGIIHAGLAHHGTVVFTHEQTRGKGQRNKSWISEKDQNIAMSMIIEPRPMVLSQVFILSMTVATGVYYFLSKHTNGDVKIKWPNDIYWRDRKAGGILIENKLKGNNWEYAVAGIGLNINQTDFKELNSKAVSLKQIKGKWEEPVKLARELCTFLTIQYNKLMEDQSLIINEYKSNLYRMNEKVKLKQGSRIFEAVIKDVTNNGQLVVRHSTEEAFNVGEVEWVV